MAGRFEIKAVRADGTFQVGNRRTKEEADALLVKSIKTGKCPFNGADIVAIEVYDYQKGEKKRHAMVSWRHVES